MSERPQVIIYTDGGALGNPGPGGYGVVMLYNQHRKELSGGYRHTTNNRMELMAAISALEKLKTPLRRDALHRLALRGRQHQPGLGQALAGQRLAQEQDRASPQS